MIVTADAAHDGQERTRLNKNRKPIADDRKGRRDPKASEDQHHDCHGDAGDESREQSGKESFRSAHRPFDLTKSCARVNRKGGSISSRNRDSRKCRNDSRSGDEGSAQCARNFRDATSASTVIDRNFENSETGTSSFHLHFQIPAVSFFFHRQSVQRVAPNRAKRAHVRVAHAVQDRHQPSYEPAGEDLLKIHAAGFAPAARARTDDEIEIPSNDRFDKLVNEFWAIAAVAIEKYDNVACGRKRADSSETGAAVPVARLAHDFRTRFACAFSSSIVAAVIDDDDLAGNFSRQTLAHNIRNRFLLVQGWNNDGNGPHRKTRRAAGK